MMNRGAVLNALRTLLDEVPRANEKGLIRGLTARLFPSETPTMADVDRLLRSQEADPDGLTVAQRVWVAKDRAVKAMNSVVVDGRGYWKLSLAEQTTLQEAARFLTLPDYLPATLEEAERLGFINGDEAGFYPEPEPQDISEVHP